MAQPVKNHRVGEIRLQNCGLEAKIVVYRNPSDMDVQFPDGTVIEHRTYRSFVIKNIRHPTLFKDFSTNVGKIYPANKSKLYHTRIHGVAYILEGDIYHYYCHCPICQAREIWTFDEIRKHECNRELVKERDALKQTYKTQADIPA